MHHTVMIKANKAGMTVYLDPDLPFDQLIHDVSEKFRETAKFWGSAQMTMTLKGRKLSAEEEIAVLDTISENSGIEIICLLDDDDRRIMRCEKALNEKLMDLSSQTGQFYKGSIRDGDVLESEASIVVIGDVQKGGKIIAKGNVIVLGSLKGSVTAGAAGNPNAVIVAFYLESHSIRIAGLSMDKKELPYFPTHNPMMILVENGRICAEPIKKSFLNALNFI